MRRGQVVWVAAIEVAIGMIACGGSTSTDDTVVEGGTSDQTVSSDATPPPPDSGGAPIKCGQTTCDSNSQECCVTFQTATCIAKGAQCQGGVLNCTSAAACPTGQICCGKF